jgi:hypothetical protein
MTHNVSLGSAEATFVLKMDNSVLSQVGAGREEPKTPENLSFELQLVSQN